MDRRASSPAVLSFRTASSSVERTVTYLSAGRSLVLRTGQQVCKRRSCHAGTPSKVSSKNPGLRTIDFGPGPSETSLMTFKPYIYAHR